MPLLLGLDALDGNSLLVDNITIHLWNCIITNRESFRFEDIWKTKLIRRGEHVYLPLSTLIRLFYTMADLRKLHKEFAHLSATKLLDLLKTAGKKVIAPKTLERL